MEHCKHDYIINYRLLWFFNFRNLEKIITCTQCAHPLTAKQLKVVGRLMRVVAVSAILFTHYSLRLFDSAIDPSTFLQYIAVGISGIVVAMFLWFVEAVILIKCYVELMRKQSEKKPNQN